MKNNKLCIRLPQYPNKFPEELPPSELEKKMNQSFKTRGMEVLHGYFVEGTPYYPQNLSFFVYARKGWLKGLASGLIATEEKYEDGNGTFIFTYYDKIFVTPPHRGNGLMADMIKVARMSHKSSSQGPLPALLRTSDFELNEAYEKLSDMGTKLGEFYIHGFGFLDKGTETELFEGAKDKFYAAANYIASKKRTVVPILSLGSMQAYK